MSSSVIVAESLFDSSANFNEKAYIKVDRLDTTEDDFEGVVCDIKSTDADDSDNVSVDVAIGYK